MNCQNYLFLDHQPLLGVLFIFFFVFVILSSLVSLVLITFSFFEMGLVFASGSICEVVFDTFSGVSALVFRGLPFFFFPATSSVFFSIAGVSVISELFFFCSGVFRFNFLLLFAFSFLSSFNTLISVLVFESSGLGEVSSTFKTSSLAIIFSSLISLFLLFPLRFLRLLFFLT